VDHGDGTATLSGMPLNEHVGDHSVTISVSDSTAPGVEQSFTISVAANPVDASVVSRHIFYNNSRWDGPDPTANANDDNAIAPDKIALRPGDGKAAFANYTSYSRGINGIMIDIAALANPAGLTAADFVFKTGNNDTPESWALAPAPTNDIALDVRLGAGVEGSDRVTLIWADNAIAKQWLEVTVLATANTGLAGDDVFYFGNAVGDTGDSTANAFVNAFDTGGVRDHPRGFLNPSPIDDVYDFNRDQRVNAFDFGIARDNSTGFLNALKLITVLETGGASSAAMAIAPQAAGSTVPEAPENFDAGNGDSAAVSPAETPMAIDLLTPGVLSAADTSSGASITAAPTVAENDAAQRYAVLQTPDFPENGEIGLEIGLLADLDPLLLLP